MSTCDNIYDKIQELLGCIPGSVSILEEQIDSDVQSEYYDYTRNMKRPFNYDEVLKNRETIFQPNMAVEDKKQLIVQLACIDSIEAYRTLEKYIGEKNELKEWATLAFKESRLLIESQLLDESQVLISTGLGGKGLKLRYFTVLISNELQPFSTFNQNIIEQELRFAIRKHGGELEKINFDKELCTTLTIIPLQAPVQRLFDEIVEECNQYGNFLHNDYMITNVKEIPNSEVRRLIGIKKNKPGK